jgi:hypothetical protein
MLRTSPLCTDHTDMRRHARFHLRFETRITDDVLADSNVDSFTIDQRSREQTYHTLSHMNKRSMVTTSSIRRIETKQEG